MLEAVRASGILRGFKNNETKGKAKHVLVTSKLLLKYHHHQ
jgi:hypothetical protein